jgi:hypothetical protein
MRLFSMTFKDIFDLKHLVKTAYRRLDVILGSLMFLIKGVFKLNTLNGQRFVWLVSICLSRFYW